MEAISRIELPPSVIIGPELPPEAPREARLPKKKPAAAEPLSPFVPWSAEERAPLPEWVAQLPVDRNLVVELLREPAAIVERLLDPVRLRGLVLGSVGFIVVGTSLFAATSSAARDAGQAGLLSAALTSLNVLMALAASLGPIYAAGMLLAARVPLARLVAALLASAASGSLVLAALSPPLYLLWRLDSEWSGPLMLLSAFLVSGAAAGARIHKLLVRMALEVTRAALGDPTAALSKDDAERVGILARVSWMMLGFTTAIGFWAFKALG